MKILKLTLLLLLLAKTSAFAQTDHEQITQTIQKFIVGTTYNYPDSINAAFFPDTRMFLYNGTDTAFHMTSEYYASLYSRREPGTKNNRINKIVNIHIVEDAAFAQLQVDVPFFGNRYNDLLLLKKIRGEWKIVSKCTSAAPIPKSPAEMVPKPAKEVVLEGLNRPWSIAFLSAEEAIIAEKDGALLRVNLQSGNRLPISGLPHDVARAIKIDTVKTSEWYFPFPGAWENAQL
ncbi:nuclear transport factor 2 family protein [Marivirga sp. S37H4]|uniref:Nuclear transport factor 2 family protein n=1 Tax=Marivirga aurantiaca TaxID=2802615 RepID=A0A935CB19_9BACT|nr:nuclear transport factor 2 family protein [Marivirga aurantiaca]MBK6267071.1 nuclear transport factor 2 family protein [Marivirga aurantiaca]